MTRCVARAALLLQVIFAEQQEAKLLSLQFNVLRSLEQSNSGEQ